MKLLAGCLQFLPRLLSIYPSLICLLIKEEKIY